MTFTVPLSKGSRARKATFTLRRSTCLCGRPLFNGPGGLYCEVFVEQLA